MQGKNFHLAFKVNAWGLPTRSSNCVISFTFSSLRTLCLFVYVAVSVGPGKRENGFDLSELYV